ARLCMTVVSLPHFCDALAFSFFFYFYVPHRALLSFPTRRSSDLGGSSMISRPAFQVFGRNDCFWWMFFLLASLKPAAMTVIFTEDRKSTRLNSSHGSISYAVFCLKKKKKNNKQQTITRHSYALRG